MKTISSFSQVKFFKSIASALVMLLFALFMVPFLMVIINSAKTSKEIIFNAIALPDKWSQLFINVKLIFTNPTDRKSVV